MTHGNINISRRGLLTALAMLGSAAPLLANGQSYPNRPVRLLVGYPPGGGADRIARALSGPLGQKLGQPIIVENRSGAAGSIAAAATANAAPDGYTLMIADRGILVFNLGLFKQLTYDPRSDFTPIGTVATSSFVLISKKNTDYRSMRELISHARKNPGVLNYAATATGSTAGMEFLKQKASIDLVRVPYKGVGPAMTAILAGEVDLMLADILSALPHIRAGTVVPLGVSSSRRSPLLPDVSTIAESSLPGYEAMTWIGLIGPKGMPEDVASRVESDLRIALTSGDVGERLMQAGMEPWTGGRQILSSLMKEEQSLWPEQLRRWGMSAE